MPKSSLEIEKVKELFYRPGMVKTIIVCVLLYTIWNVAWIWYGPRYKVYEQDLIGQANLRQQEWEKQIAVEAAKAKKESAVLEAQAEIERAKGVAEANKIIGEGLRGNEDYLRYLWITGLKNENSQVIYVPTEAGLPILEAGRLPKN